VRSKTAIVCVDDEEIVLSSLKRQLRRHFGHEYLIEVAADGDEALEVIEELTNDGIALSVIISDYIMPAMRGDELLKRVHVMEPRAVTILLTGHANTEGVTNAVNHANLYRYIAKPWEQTDLILTVTEALRSYAQEKKLEEHIEALEVANRQLEHMNESLEIQVAARTAELQEAYSNLKILHNRMEHDLTFAREIQQGLLPAAQARWNMLEVACYSLSAHELGGDFYRYQEIDPSRFAVMVGDVSGKGVSAALLMAVSITLLDTSLHQELPPEQRMVWLDQAVAHYAESHRQNCALSTVEFVVNPDQAVEACIVYAGGIAPFIRRQSGKIEWPEIGGFALGQRFGALHDYQQMTLSLSRGDMVILVSDGVVEAKNVRDEMFGFERVERAIAGSMAKNAAEMTGHLVAEVSQFVDGYEPADDLTIVVARIT
jgi:serine phosphatase RsbU (regulator of sigma subunit)